MAIQWYPGHMHKAQKEIGEIMPGVDVIIEVLDARIPYSSENPMVSSLRGDKPCIKVLNKSDLADPELTQAWQAHLEKERGIKTFAISCAQQPQMASQLLKLVRQTVPNKGSADKQINALICGIPNVGKSTLINILAGRIVAKTGNEPAVTKAQQRIRLDGHIVLRDTPGMLWPKFDNEASGYRLAVTGAVKDTAISHDEVAAFAAEYLLLAYPTLIKERYGFESLPESEIELLEEIGRKRGCLVRGGHIDFTKVSTIVLNELRDATLGRITLESPEMAVAEQAAVDIMLAEKAADPNKQKRRKRPRRY
ncbi:ribosome biogenesis GTPase YlqF [Alginatibacterium sediminis]|uniref:Ribosome biogenesis GTPase A n=1 Tax=Alginatibacterium sediminis TaxID=2164068 RepID=A0A420E5W2_9ALTE|nr:ribosome biogenesis GTPase YlqF [Alginatibacterium sediminis]RKF13184.1 ribosome biogenesis GTPase YlqF [Alginatibacterium sediminis]